MSYGFRISVSIYTIYLLSDEMYKCYHLDIVDMVFQNVICIIPFLCAERNFWHTQCPIKKNSVAKQKPRSDQLWDSNTQLAIGALHLPNITSFGDTSSFFGAPSNHSMVVVLLKPPAEQSYKDSIRPVNYFYNNVSQYADHNLSGSN